MLVSWGRRRGVGDSLGCWAGAQQDDRTLKTRGKGVVGVTGAAGSSSAPQEVGRTPHAPGMSFARGNINSKKTQVAHQQMGGPQS